MSDLISRKAVEKIIRNFFKTKVSEIPKQEKFNRLCDLCDLYLELNADLHKEIENIPVAYDVDKVVKQLRESERYVYDSVTDEDYHVIVAERAIEIVKGGRNMNEGDIEKYLNRNVDRSKKEVIKHLIKKFNLKKERAEKIYNSWRKSYISN